MKKNNSNYISSLYLSVIDFKSLSIFEDLKFNIKLLICPGFNSPYIDETNASPEFKSLGQNASIPQIIELMDLHKLSVTEFALEAESFSLQSVIGNDLLVKFHGDDSITELVISRVMNLWQIPNVNYSQSDIEKIKPNILFEIFSNNGTPQAIAEIPNEVDLIEYLWKQENDEIIATCSYQLRSRICFLKGN